MPDSASVAAKAATLIESLPWLRRFHGRIMVIKFGGNAMVDHELQRNFAQDMVYLRYVGIKPVVVHGGGPQISQMLGNLGIVSEFRSGYRVTTPAVMAVVREVLVEQVAAQIVSLINENEPLATALSAENSELFVGRKRTMTANGERVDLGQVGDVVQVNSHSVLQHLDAGRIPVVSSIAVDCDDQSQLLNVNADAAAAALAVSLGAEKLVVLTDVTGLYADWPKRDSVIPVITAEQLRVLLPSLESGMIPKMTACLHAVDAGVPKAAIIDGRIPHSILLEIFTQGGIGTEVVLGAKTS